ncbi:MAG: amidohydrolase [Acidobacteria bacterium]|nr:amidohydrolase [Acidobacteriota bacterium]MCA1609485.1 amidohydrolase [Acidobacteriota bacterium]
MHPTGPGRHPLFVTAILCACALVLGGAAPRRKPKPAASERSASAGAAADLLVVGGRVVTMDASFSVIEDGGLFLSGGKIVAVGRSADLKSQYQGKPVWDAQGRILMPGLVNTHGHAAMTLLRGLADDLTLDKWLTEHIFPAEAKNVSPEFVYDGTLLACLEMIEGGTTTFADMYYFESEAARAVDRAGLRGVLGETFIDFPVPDHKDLPATLAVMKAFAAKWKSHPRIVPAAAPHAPYTCSKETLVAARDFALAENIPLLIHVAETRKEVDDARKAWQQTPFMRLASVGFFDPGAGGRRVPILAAHGVWMDEGDIAIARQYGIALSHNPESNMKLASGTADVPGWQKAGLVWGLGTDGPAGSNNDLSMFEAMDFAGKLAKVSKMDPTVLPARDLVAAATRGGAKALGLEAKIGSLEPGKQADFIAVRTKTAHEQPFDDPYSALVYSIKTSDVSDVWVDGRRLLADGRSTTLDAAAILEKAASWRRRVDASLASPKGETPK